MSRKQLLSSVLAVSALAVLPAPALAQVDQTTKAKIVPAAIVGGQFLVRVTVNGQGAYMQVDTGATSSVIDSRSAAALGLQPAGDPVKTTELGCTSSAQPVAVSNWSVGSVGLPPLTVTAPKTLGKVARYHGLPVIGLLGNDALSSFGTVAVDFLDKRLVLGGRFLDTGRAVDAGALVDKATGQVQLFLANITIGGKRTLFGIDTGASVSTIEGKLARALKLKKVLKPLKVSAVTCKAKVRPVFVRGWKTGKVTLPSDIALARDTGLAKFKISGLLGASVLSGFGQVTFDYVNRQVSLGYAAPDGAELAAAAQ